MHKADVELLHAVIRRPMMIGRMWILLLKRNVTFCSICVQVLICVTLMSKQQMVQVTNICEQHEEGRQCRHKMSLKRLFEFNIFISGHHEQDVAAF